MDSHSNFRNCFKLVVQLAVVLLLASTCGILDVPDLPSNPMDPSDPSFQPPTVTFAIAPGEGSTVDTCYALMAWVGNQPGMSFSYQMDSEGWSDWAGDTSTIYPYLDEGTHTFQIKSRYYNGVESQGAESLSFEIDDIHGPALRLVPRRIVVPNGFSFSLEVYLEEVENVAGLKAVLFFDPVCFHVDRIDVYNDSRSLLMRTGGTVIPFYGYDNTSGSMTIEVGTAIGEPLGVSGTGPVAIISFVSRQVVNTKIEFMPTCVLRNPTNEEIPISELSSAIVEVQ